MNNFQCYSDVELVLILQGSVTIIASIVDPVSTDLLSPGFVKLQIC